MSTERALAPTPQGAYASAVLHDGVVYSAGMTPRRDGQLTVSGVVGATVSVPEARRAAGLAAANALAAIRSMLPADANPRCLRMTVYVACAPGFHQLSTVADGASEALGAAGGLPARSAIGVQALPSGAPVEVDLIAAVGASSP